METSVPIYVSPMTHSSKSGRAKSLIRRVFAWGNIAAILTIAVGVFASLGLLEKFTTADAVLLGVVTLLATQILVDRVGILSDIRLMLGKRRKYEIELKPRTDASFERFSDFVRNAKEVFVVGVDLGFLANADAYFVKSAIASGVLMKLMICDPDAGRALGDVLDNHDERNRKGGPKVHDHLSTAKTTLITIQNLAEEAGLSSIEVRARVDIPAPTLTMVDPTTPFGRIRVELKPYKNNHGDVPFFVLDRTSVWYEVFLDRYYHKLWNDSEVLFVSAEVKLPSAIRKKPNNGRVSARRASDC